MPASTEVRAWPTRLARAMTEVFAPAVWAGGMPLVIAVHSTSPAWVRGAAWGLLAALFCSVVPYGIIHLGVRRGRLTDRHIGVREQRRMPLLHGLLSVLIGLGALISFGAPRPLVVLVVVLFAVGVVVTVINQVWKLSAHAAVAAGSAGVLVLVFGPALLGSFLLVALVAWSRVRLRDHTVGQVVTGAVAGVLIAVPTFLALG